MIAPEGLSPVIMTDTQREVSSGIRNETQLFWISAKMVRQLRLLVPSLNSGETIKEDMEPGKQQELEISEMILDGASELGFVDLRENDQNFWIQLGRWYNTHSRGIYPHKLWCEDASYFM